MNVKVLNKEEHQALKFTPTTDFSFAKPLKLIPITINEVKHLCCHFPVVVTELEGNDTLAIIISLGEHNVAINENGKFKGKYTPAYLRRHPFILIGDTANDKVLLGFQDNEINFDTSDGEALFDDEGNATPLTKNIMEFMKTFENEMQQTKNILMKFKALNLLEPSQTKVNINDTEQIIGGFSIINKEQFLSQEDKFLSDAVRNGWTELIELHRLSLNNFPMLLQA